MATAWHPVWRSNAHGFEGLLVPLPEIVLPALSVVEKSQFQPLTLEHKKSQAIVGLPLFRELSSIAISAARRALRFAAG